MSLSISGADMSENVSYKHIKVSSARNDEVVIKAGRHADYQKDEPALERSSAVDADPVEKDQQNSRETKSSDRGRDITPEKVADTYEPTTLDDIEASKMSKVQIVVIAAAAVAIAAFIVWYIPFL